MRRPSATSINWKLSTFICALVFAVSWCSIALWGSERQILLLLVAILSFLAWRSLWQMPTIFENRSILSSIELMFAIARDAQLFYSLLSLLNSLHKISQRNDTIFRQVAMKRMQQVCETTEILGHGIIHFHGTEAWRLTYEELLRSPGLHQYRSVALIDSPDYWLSEPGRQGLKLNLQLHDKEILRIERIVILNDALWPADSELPIDKILDWIHEQYTHGIWICLVRKSQLLSEPELLTDMGIYGSRAVGIQTLDEFGRTVDFELNFDFQAVVEAEATWERLGIYATNYADLLDRRQGDR